MKYLHNMMLFNYWLNYKLHAFNFNIFSIQFFKFHFSHFNLSTF